jgi:Putative DNA-binding domain
LSRSPRKSQAIKKRQTLKELQDLQRLAAGMIMRPLARDMRINPKWRDGKLTAQVAATFIKPNDRLTSVERVEIYNRQYWFRLIDCLYEDYPGLHAILGHRKFDNLIHAYLEKYPSRCFTLRNLGDRLHQFITERPDLVKPIERLAREMAAFEWAQVVAFDGPEFPPLDVDSLLGKNPAKLKMAVQPYITLVELHYSLDDFAIGLKEQQTALRSEASNAVDAPPDQTSQKITKPPRIKPVYIAVHRHSNDLYFKRMQREQYLLLSSLRDGVSVEKACRISMADADEKIDWPPLIREWFKTWTELGWFCRKS